LEIVKIISFLLVFDEKIYNLIMTREMKIVKDKFWDLISFIGVLLHIYVVIYVIVNVAHAVSNYFNININLAMLIIAFLFYCLSKVNFTEIRKWGDGE